MRIDSIELTNYGPFYGTHKFKLSDRGLTLVMGNNLDESRMSSNAAGKSHIFDALDWCTFGKVPRDDYADSVMNEEVANMRGSGCRVLARFIDDAGRVLEIERSFTKSKNSLEFRIDGDNKFSALDTAQTQKEIEKHIGLDRTIFHAAVLFSQTDLIHYADATDAKRMDILTKILQLDEIDNYLELAKTKLKTSKEQHQNADVKLASLEGKLDGLRGIDYNAQIAQWEADNQGTIQRLQREVIDTQTVITQNSVGLDTAFLTTSLAQLEQERTTLVKPGRSKLQEPQLNLNSVIVELATVKQEERRIQGEVQKFQTMGKGDCSECGQAVTQEHLQLEIQKRKHSLSVLAEQMSVLDTSQTQWQVQLQQAENIIAQEEVEFQRISQEKFQQIATIKQDIQSLESRRQIFITTEQKVKSLEFEIQRVSSTTNPFLEKRAEVEFQINAVEQESLELTTTITGLENEQEYLEFWVEGFGAKGLKSYILDSRLQELTDAANHWVNILTGGTIWVRFEAQKQTKKKQLKNSPDIRVFRWNPDGTITERRYRSWSGGEKQRISFAVDFGLSRLIAQRAKQKYDILILDEVFKHLDRAGKEAVMEMLQELSREKSSLFVVEHDVEFQSQFENRVMVEKRNRRSTIKELDNDATKEQKSEVRGTSVQARAVSKRKPKRTPVRRPVTSN